MFNYGFELNGSPQIKMGTVIFQVAKDVFMCQEGFAFFWKRKIRVLHHLLWKIGPGKGRFSNLLTVE